MNAEFYSSEPSSDVSGQPQAGVEAKRRLSRRIHRWVATLFTLTVAANFVALPWGQPPAFITYAPLVPLLVLTVTGLTMLISSWIASARTSSAAKKGMMS